MLAASWLLVACIVLQVASPRAAPTTGAQRAAACSCCCCLLACGSSSRSLRRAGALLRSPSCLWLLCSAWLRSSPSDRLLRACCFSFSSLILSQPPPSQAAAAWFLILVGGCFCLWWSWSFSTVATRRRSKKGRGMYWRVYPSSSFAGSRTLLLATSRVGTHESETSRAAGGGRGLWGPLPLWLLVLCCCFFTVRG